MLRVGSDRGDESLDALWHGIISNEVCRCSLNVTYSVVQVAILSDFLPQLATQLLRLLRQRRPALRVVPEALQRDLADAEEVCGPRRQHQARSESELVDAPT